MASSPTSEVQKFFAFPPGTNSATAADDIEAYGENVAIINEWQRRHFQPRIDKLKPFGDGAWIIDRYFAREVLCLSRDWYLFDCVVCEEDLPPSLKEAFEERGRSLLGQLGDYWKRYSRGMERWRTRLTDYLAVDDETEQKLRMWCVVEKLDAYQLMKILTDEGDTALWRAFRMGLNQCVQGRWPSKYFREMQHWEYRFLAMSRCLWPDLLHLGYIGDPVTLGGAMACYNMNQYKMNDPHQRLAYYADNVSNIFQFVNENTWEPVEHKASQAISAFLIYTTEGQVE
ncbi:hypothetical protein GGG16DRAFT_109842 [Schizophyllum commune]